MITVTGTKTITNTTAAVFAGSPILAIGVSVILGIAKEVYDSRGHGTVEVLDVVATIVGGVVGAILARVVM